MRVQKGILAILFVALAGPAQAQLLGSLFYSEVEVTLLRPPFLDIQAKRIAFAPATNPEAEELVKACIAEFKAAQKVEVLDRDEVEKGLKAQAFSDSSLADNRTVAELGRQLGPTVLFVLRVDPANVSRTSRSEARAEWKDKYGEVHPSKLVYISKTQVEYRLTLQVADLESGTVYSPQHISTAPSLEQTSDRSNPAFPTETEVRGMAIAQAVAQVRQMLLPSTETQKRVFFDDKDLGLRDAYERLQQKDIPGALAKAKESLAKAKTGAKSRSVIHANYNLGLCHYILGEYASAMPFLTTAREMDSDNKVYRQAADECEQALRRSKEMAQVATRRAAPPMVSPEPSATKGTIEERLERLDALRKKGLITQEDFDKRKTEILGEL